MHPTTEKNGLTEKDYQHMLYFRTVKHSIATSGDSSFLCCWFAPPVLREMV